MIEGKLMCIRRVVAVAAAGVLLAATAGATPALAGAPRWRLTASATPTNLPPGSEGKIVVMASNLGDATMNGAGAPVTITDTLPLGLTATAILGASQKPGYPDGRALSSGPMNCKPLPELSCTFEEALSPYGSLKVIIAVRVEPTASSGADEVTIAGGGAPPKSVSEPLTVDGAPTPFGIESYELSPESEDGSLDTQAGSHPFQLTTAIALNQADEFSTFGFEDGGPTLPKPPALARNLRFNLPPGMIGNPTVIPQCTDLEFAHVLGPAKVDQCLPDTAVGVASVTASEPRAYGLLTFTVPVFNLEPAVGEPARFGFLADRTTVVLDTAVRTGGDYGVTVNAENITQAAGLLSSSVTLWGVPGDPRHDQSRGWACLRGEAPVGEPGCAPLGQSQPPPFLTLPTSCTGPLKTTVEGESWPTIADPAGISLPPFESSSTDSLEGCGQLPFNPSIGVETEERAASTPTGFNVDVHVPQQSTLESTLEEAGRAEADVKQTTVALPEGIQLSPSAAYGLLSCSALQTGFTGFAEGLQERQQLENDHFSSGTVGCPEESKVGTVEIETPFLRHKLEGSVYLATQDTNPFQSPMVLYLIAEDPEHTGVRVKLAGKVTPSATTGQLVSTFENTPQAPFEDLRLHFFGGPRASLTTPPLCGAYTTSSSFTPWSGGASQTPSASFTISSGPKGASCSNPQPFAPSFQAGTSSQAGAFTPFTLTIERPDGDQALKSIDLQLPPGLAAMLASVTPCPEPQAARGTCGPESEIGHSVTSAGLGGEPYTLPGNVYLTGPYDGAPFGLSSVTPAVAGPFNLGNIVVRSSITINPYTAAASINTAAATVISATGEEKPVEGLPEMIEGVPSQIKQLTVTVERPEGKPFQFNPTNCSPMAVTGTLTGWQGASKGVSYPFQVSNCAKLPFKPKLTASAGGHASKADGASLNVKIESAGQGQANIAKVDLQLPKALPSRLTTIQKACVYAVFNANPAACDEGSVIGKATIHTPVLKSPLTGPAYLVSHGGAAFPDVEFVLQGEGITLILDGKTDIKKGITYSRFESSPDAPFTTFETELPTGPHSALAAYVPAKADYSLCRTGLAMPTEITGQNGAVIKQTTNIELTGCKGVLASKVTKAQLLAKALKACKKKKPKSKRVACEKQARKKYGAKASKKKTSKTKKKK